MDKQEFIRLCQLCGYASKKNATLYSETKELFTQADFEEINRINERQNDLSHGILTWNRDKGCHGDDLLDMLGRKPKPWRRVFDASRGINDK